MTGRFLVVLLALVLPALTVAGCGGNDGGSSSTTTPSLEEAQPFADDFMRRLVEGGKWKLVRTDVSPLIQKEVRTFQRQLVKDQVRTVRGSGSIRHDCPPNVALGTGADCFAYTLGGVQVEPISGKRTTIRSRMRVWFDRTTDGWELLAYDYDVLDLGK